jgi:hypothetical protein
MSPYLLLIASDLLFIIYIFPKLHPISFIFFTPLDPKLYLNLSFGFIYTFSFNKSSTYSFEIESNVKSVDNYYIKKNIKILLKLLQKH